MKTAHIIVGQQYAYLRGKYGSPARVEVIALGPWGTLHRYHPTLNRRTFEAIAEQADLSSSDTIFSVADENATVAFRYVTSGGLSSNVTLVNARHIQRTWEEQVVLDAEAAAARERAAEARRARDAQREVDVAEFHAEALEFLRAIESLGVVTDVTDHGPDHWRSLSAKGAHVANTGPSQSVTLDRAVVKGLTGLLRTLIESSTSHAA